MIKLKKILIMSFILSMVGSAVVFGILYITDKESLTSSYSLKEDFEVKDIANIEIDSCCRVSFVKLPEDEKPYAEFVYKSTGITTIEPKYELKVKEEGGVLKIGLQYTQSTMIYFGSTNAHLSVYLPDMKFENAVIRCDGLDMENGFVDAKKLDLNVNYDDVELTNNFEECTINMDDGNIKVSSDVDCRLNVYTDYGNIDLIGSFSDVKAESKDGHIKVSSDVNCRLNASTDYGNIDLTGNFLDVKAESKDGDIKVWTNNKLDQLFAETKYGNVTLALTEDVTGFELAYDISDGKLTSDYTLKAELNGESRKKGIAYFGDESIKMEVTAKDGNINIEKWKE